MVGIIIAIIATLVIAVPVSAYVANTRSKKAMEITIGNAEDKAREIIDEAIKAADAKKREASLEVKEETIKARHDFEKETKERRAELQKYEQRVLSKEETVEKKATVLERKEQSLKEHRYRESSVAGTAGKTSTGTGKNFWVDL